MNLVSAKDKWTEPSSCPIGEHFCHSFTTPTQNKAVVTKKQHTLGEGARGNESNKTYMYL